VTIDVPETTSTADQALDARLDPRASPWVRPRWLLLLAVLPIALALPLFLNSVTGGRFWLHLLIIFFVWAIVTQSWNLLLAVSGIYSFGQIALFAVGGWTAGYLALHGGLNPWISIWFAPFAAAAAAVVIGLPTLRLRGAYVVLITLAFLELLRNFLVNSPYEKISGGGYGLLYVPKLDFGSLGDGRKYVMFYYTGLIFFAIATYFIWRIFHSPLGMAFTALRDSETYAVSRGVNQFRARLFLFVFCAFFTGLAAGLLTHYQGAISPSILGFGVLINLLAMIVIGGWGTFWGPIFGTAFLILLQEKWLRGGQLEEYRKLVLGLMLALIAVFAPRGLFPVIADGVRRLIKGPEREDEEGDEDEAPEEGRATPIA